MLTETSTWVTGGKGRSQEQESSTMSTVTNLGTFVHFNIRVMILISIVNVIYTNVITILYFILIFI